MTLDTTLFNVRMSFTKLIRAIVSEIETEINTALGTSHTIKVYSQGEVKEFPAIRVNFPAKDGIFSNRQKTCLVQLDVFTQNTQPDERLPDLICPTILRKLGLTTGKAVFYSIKDNKDYFSSLTSPDVRGRSTRIELASEEGWRGGRDEEDPTIYHYSCDLNLFYRK